MTHLEQLIQELESHVKGLEDPDHPLMMAAESEDGQDVYVEIVSQALVKAKQAFDEALQELKNVALTQKEDDSNEVLDKHVDLEIDEESLEEMAAIASEFDATGDPLLVRQASVLDQILLTIGAPKGAVRSFKEAQEKEVENIRKQMREESGKTEYQAAKESHDKEMKSTEMVESVKEHIKEYRPLQSSLSTRTCPDHPGAQMARVGENAYQCDLDKKVYNFQTGFTTAKGNKVPGGDVSNQTLMLGDRDPGKQSFSTRQDKLNS